MEADFVRAVLLAYAVPLIGIVVIVISYACQ